MSSTTYVSFTAPINPPNSSPIITPAQVWSALQLKIRAGQDFIPGAILSTDVIEERVENGLAVTVREVVFKAGNRRVREVCTAYAPMRVDFLQTNGSIISNIISKGSPDSTNPDVPQLYMTYTFEWKHPELAGNSEGLAAAKEKEEAMSKGAVEGSIEAIRRMVKEGKL